MRLCPGLETLIWFWPPEQPLWAGPASALASPAPSRCPSALRVQAAESQRRPIWEGAPNTEWAARFSDQAQGCCWKTLGTSVLIAHLMEEAKEEERLVTQWVNIRAGTRTQMLTPRLGGLLLLQDTVCFLQGWPISSSPLTTPPAPSPCGGSDGLVAKLCLTLFLSHALYSARFLCPWDFPDKSTGVGGHFFLQGIFPT